MWAKCFFCQATGNDRMDRLTVRNRGLNMSCLRRSTHARTHGPRRYAIWLSLLLCCICCTLMTRILVNSHNQFLLLGNMCDLYAFSIHCAHWKEEKVFFWCTDRQRGDERGRSSKKRVMCINQWNELLGQQAESFTRWANKHAHISVEENQAFETLLWAYLTHTKYHAVCLNKFKSCTEAWMCRIRKLLMWVLIRTFISLLFPSLVFGPRTLDFSQLMQARVGDPWKKTQAETRKLRGYE